jgi:hypothetical protein
LVSPPSIVWNAAPGGGAGARYAAARGRSLRSLRRPRNCRLRGDAAPGAGAFTAAAECASLADLPPEGPDVFSR